MVYVQYVWGQPRPQVFGLLFGFYAQPECRVPLLLGS